MKSLRLLISVMMLMVWQPTFLFAVEPAPPIEVSEWMKAFESRHPSLRRLTTPELVLALSSSDRLKEIVKTINKPVGSDREWRARIVPLYYLNCALNQLELSGYSKEVAKVDAAIFAKLDRLDGVYLDAMARMAKAGDRKGVLRMAETLLLSPACDRHNTMDLKKENTYTIRSPFKHVLPILKQAGVLSSFKRMAMKRVESAPEDLKSLKVLTLVELYESGDNPRLWDRLLEKMPAYELRNLRLFIPYMKFAYQLKIPAPYLCAKFENPVTSKKEVRPLNEFLEMPVGMRVKKDKKKIRIQPFDVRVKKKAPATSKKEAKSLIPSMAVEDRLLLAAMWLEVGEVEKSKKIHRDILSEYEKKKEVYLSDLLHNHASILITVLGHRSFENDPIIDRWVALVKKSHAQGNCQLRDILNLCRYSTLPRSSPTMARKWFDLVDPIFQKSVKTDYGDFDLRDVSEESFEQYFILLLNAGLLDRAEHWQVRLAQWTRHMVYPPIKVARYARWIKNAKQNRKPLLQPIDADTLIGSFRWQRASSDSYGYSDMSGLLESADVFVLGDGPKDRTITYYDEDENEGISKKLGNPVPILWQDDVFYVSAPKNQSSVMIRPVVNCGGEKYQFLPSQPIPPYPNLLNKKDGWSAYLDDSLFFFNLKLGDAKSEAEFNYMLEPLGGGEVQTRSTLIPLEDGMNYMFSGCLHGINRLGVSVEFVGKDGSVIRRLPITTFAYTPGERWFRVILRASSQDKGRITIPADATSLRVVLKGRHLGYSHLRFTRMGLASVKNITKKKEPLDRKSKLLLSFKGKIAAMAVSEGYPTRKDKLAVAVPKQGQVFVYEVPGRSGEMTFPDPLQTPVVHQIPKNMRVLWMAVAKNGTVSILEGLSTNRPTLFYILRPGKKTQTIELKHVITLPTLAEDGKYLFWLEKKGDQEQWLVMQPLGDDQAKRQRVKLVNPGKVIVMGTIIDGRFLEVQGGDWGCAYALPGLTTSGVAKKKNKHVSKNDFRWCGFFDNANLLVSCPMKPIPNTLLTRGGGAPRALLFFPGKVVSIDIKTGRSVGSAPLEHSSILHSLLVELEKTGSDQHDLLIVPRDKPNEIRWIPHALLKQYDLLKM